MSSEIERVFVVGGDGTLREVAAGAIEAGLRPSLGHIPQGNANVVARELGISMQPKKAIAQLLGGRDEPFDGMRVNGEFALAMVGVGYDALVAQGIERARRGRLGKLYRWNGGHGVCRGGIQKPMLFEQPSVSVGS